MTPPKPRRWLLSADLGQSSDPTAIGLWERLPTHDVARSLERPELGTSYPDIVRRLGAIVRNAALIDGVDVLLDATGVGRPVVDMCREELRGTTSRLVAIIIGSGQHAHQDTATGYWTVPKRVLVAAMQVAMQSKRLRVPSTLALAETMVREMRAFKIKVSVESGHQSFEAWRSGDHDDLVLQAAQAAWWSSRLTRPAGGTPEESEATRIKDAALKRASEAARAREKAARDSPWRRAR